METLGTSPATDSPVLRFRFKNTFTGLPARFYAHTRPTPVRAPRLIQLNATLARELGLDPEALQDQQGAEIFSGNLLPADADPIALAYAGHQFGHFVPQLGDGRAILLGEIVAEDGKRYDLQLKGAGRTPFSRGGDGRAALGPVLREYLLSEAMHALGVPSTRALAAVTTGETVLREGPLPGAVFTRVAASHLRVGSFQYFFARRDTEAIRTLADYAIGRHFPAAGQSTTRYRAFLDGVVTRQANLIAQWMHLGFIHGVMNTDNSSISGETIDFGPCAFLEAYVPDQVFSSIDRQGRYAFSNQAQIALWNLTRLAETLLPLLEQEHGSPEAGLASAQEALAAFAPQFQAAHLAGLRRKLGLFTEQEGDGTLIEGLLERMAVHRADFTLTFRRLCDAAAGPEGDPGVRALFADPEAFDAWAVQWRQRLAQQPGDATAHASAMRQVNPLFIPRNHLVHEALTAAIDRQDFKPFEDLLAVVTRPYADNPDRERYATPATPEQRVTETFCGT